MESNILIKQATYNVIKTALENGFDVNSNFIEFYAKCAKSIRDSNNPEETVKISSLRIFPDEDSYLQKKLILTEKYKGRLQTDLMNLYNLYHLLAIEERNKKESKVITDDDIDELLDSLA